MTMTQENKPEEKFYFNAVPHHIPSDFRNKKLKRTEVIVYLWLRACADKFGIVTTSLADLRDDMFPGKGVNHVNRILLALKRKKYVHFDNRQGRRGTFEVRFDEWLLKGGKVSSIDRFFENQEGGGEEIREERETNEGNKSEEVGQNSEAQNQELLKKKSELVKQFSGGQSSSKVRSYYTNTETKTEIENHGNTLRTFNRTKTSDFEAKSSEQARVLEIAKDVGDEYVNPLLSVLRTDGLRIIERAWSIVKEDRAAGKPIHKSEAAYLMAIIKKLRQQNQ